LAGLAVDQENGCSCARLLLDGRHGLGLVVGDGLVNSRRISFDGCDANPGSRFRGLEAFLDGDLALVFLGDAPTRRLHDLVGLRANLCPSLLHILFGLPVGNAQTVPGLLVSHERYPCEAFLPLDEAQDVLCPELEVLTGSGRIALHPNYASVHAWHLLKGEYDLPESPGRPNDFTPSKRRWLSLSLAVFYSCSLKYLKPSATGKSWPFAISAARSRIVCSSSD